jgi:hypothetical protein
MKIHDALNAPWTLTLDHDGSEEFGIIRDADGHALVCSRLFWLPDGWDRCEFPPTLSALLVMKAAPRLLSALQAFIDVEDLANECADWNWDDLATGFAQARALIAELKGGRS